MEAWKIIGLSILAAVVYGIVHDQVTARVCVEYFTIGHPRILDSESPTLLGFAWGIIATWWVGLPLGALLAFAARRGSRPKRSARSLVRPLAMLLACMAVVSIAAGLVGYALAASGAVVLVEPLAASVPSDRHVPFLANLWAHSASYLAGVVGGLVLVRRVWRSRMSPPAEPFADPEHLDTFVTETRMLLREQGLAAASDVLGQVQETGYTTSSEWLGDLGTAVRAIEQRFSIPRDLAARLARIMAAVHRAWPQL